MESKADQLRKVRRAQTYVLRKQLELLDVPGVTPHTPEMESYREQERQRLRQVILSIVSLPIPIKFEREKAYPGCFGEGVDWIEDDDPRLE